MQTKYRNNIHTQDNSESHNWFEEMISSLRIDQLLMQTDTIGRDKSEMYKAMIEGDYNKIHDNARNLSSQYFIKNLVGEYIEEIVERRTKLSRLALELMNSKILVWAEIEDDDENAEKSLILSAAKVNNEFHRYGFHISPTIVEKSDRLDIPKHYIELPFVI